MFLWWENYAEEKLRVFRHRRLVFGVNCSPFLLAAVIELHLQTVREERTHIADKLLKSLYVDNCVTSVDTMKEYDTFRMQATEIMTEAKMDLRQRECSMPEHNVSKSDLTSVTIQPKCLKCLVLFGIKNVTHCRVITVIYHSM
jgi:hypothetical protein